MTNITDEEKQARESRIVAMAANFNSDEEQRRAGLDAMNELNRQLRLFVDTKALIKEKQEIKDEISILKETKKKGRLSSKKSERLEELEGKLSTINTELETTGLPKGMTMHGLEKLHDQRLEEYNTLTAALGRTSTEINSTSPANENQTKLQEQIDSLNAEITAAKEAKKKAEELATALSEIDDEKARSDYESALRNIDRIRREIDSINKDLESPIALHQKVKHDRPLTASEELSLSLEIERVLEKAITEKEADLATQKKERVRVYNYSAKRRKT